MVSTKQNRNLKKRKKTIACSQQAWLGGMVSIAVEQQLGDLDSARQRLRGIYGEGEEGSGKGRRG